MCPSAPHWPEHITTSCPASETRATREELGDHSGNHLTTAFSGGKKEGAYNSVTYIKLPT